MNLFLLDGMLEKDPQNLKDGISKEPCIFIEKRKLKIKSIS